MKTSITMSLKNMQVYSILGTKKPFCGDGKKNMISVLDDRVDSDPELLSVSPLSVQAFCKKALLSLKPE